MSHFKDNRFTVLDSVYFDAIAVLSNTLYQAEIPYAIVGGGAFQIGISSILTEQGHSDIKGVGGLDVLLRDTGDIDLTTNPQNDGQVIHAFNEIAGYSSFDVINYRGKSVTLQRGPDRVIINYQTEPADLKGMPEHYEHIIESAQEVRIRRGNNYLHANIPTIEYLLVSKLMRSASKDLVDIHNVLTAIERRKVDIDLEEVRGILKSIGKGEKFDFIKEIVYDIGLPTK